MTLTVHHYSQKYKFSSFIRRDTISLILCKVLMSRCGGVLSGLSLAPQPGAAHEAAQGEGPQIHETLCLVESGGELKALGVRVGVRRTA